MIEEAADRGVLLEALEAPDALILQLLQGRKPRWPGSDDTPQPSKAPQPIGCLGHRLSAAHTHLARWSHRSDASDFWARRRFSKHLGSTIPYGYDPRLRRSRPTKLKPSFMARPPSSWPSSASMYSKASRSAPAKLHAL